MPTPQTIAQQEDPNLKIFQSLIAKIADRNYELGECFTNNITFISYENNTLSWESCADEECKKLLKHGYGVIKQLVREIFGFETSIKGVPCSKPIEEPLQQEQHQTAPMEQPTMTDAPQPTSMIEDVEIGGGASCVTNCNEDSIQDEVNGTDITQEPLVQKAIEMFEAKKVTVQSKV